MASFKVQGGNKLKGEITPQGAKNEALQVVCAVLLSEEKVTLKNIPHIRDINKLLELLATIGVKLNKLDESTIEFDASNVDIKKLESDEFKDSASSIRGSVMILGPLLARFGKGRLPKPGGDKIGRRPMDTHFIGLQSLGAKFSYDSKTGFFEIDATDLNGTDMLLDEASVTGTANILMAAVLAKGTTTIYNAACEPYIQQLCSMLISMGAKISGVGSNLLTIEGVKKLGGCTHTILPDMIEIGSFIGLAAMTESDLTIKNCRIDMLGMIPRVFKKLGISLEIKGDDIHVKGSKGYEIQTLIDGSIPTIADAPWPGFTPDLLSIVLVVCSQAKGTVLIHQKMFESRLFFVDKLIDMGAQIILCDPHRATVVGLERKSKLRAITMTSPDIRAGVSLLIAALSAEGTSTIHNVEQIDRGYQFIDTRLNNLGANIQRI